MSVRLIDGRPQKVVFSIRKSFDFNRFAPSSTVKIRFTENKSFESVNFGTLGSLKMADSVERSLDYRFSRPSCQLRVIESGEFKKGLLLGSTSSWTLESNAEGDSSSQSVGILYFAVRTVAPQSWTLEIRENDYPTIYVDESIPNAKAWAKGDHVFASLVLPSVVRDIFEEILQASDHMEWMVDWKNWARDIGINDAPPTDGNREERRQWIDKVVDRFANKHRLNKNLIASLPEN